MKLNEIRNAQNEEAAPTLSDLLFALQGETPLSFTIEEVLDLLEIPEPEAGMPPMQFLASNTTLNTANYGGIVVAVADIDLTVDAEVEQGWFVWIFNQLPTPLDLTLPAGAVGPTEIGSGVFILGRGPDDLSDPENPVPSFGGLLVKGPKAAHVGDADDTSLASLASSIDEVRDALVAAGLMAAS